MLHQIRITLAAAAVTAMLAGTAMAQSDSRYDRDRYRYDDYGNRQQDDQRYDQRSQSSQRSGYADLFETERRSPRNVYGYDEPVYEPPREDQDRRRPAQPQTPYRGQLITGQVRDVSTKKHDDVQHRHITVRTSSGQDMEMDLGPMSQLGGLNLKRGERVRIMGQYRTVDGGQDEFVADRIQAEEEQRLLIDRELKHQWVTGNVVGQARTGFTLRTDDGRRVLVDLGPAAEQVDLSQGQRIQALGTLAEFEGQPVLIATQLRSLHTAALTQQQSRQQPQRRVEDKDEDDEDEWRNFGRSILEDVFR